MDESQEPVQMDVSSRDHTEAVLAMDCPQPLLSFGSVFYTGGGGNKVFPTLSLLLGW